MTSAPSIDAMFGSKRARLFIYGISLEDIDKVPVAEELPAETVTDYTQYTELPAKFSLDTWPKTSNLRCHHCDEIPTGYPRFIPKNASMSVAGPTCDPDRHYCDWQCAAAGVVDHYPEAEHHDLLTAICIFEAAIEKIPRRDFIVPADPRTTMKAWAGASGLSLAEWREKNASKKGKNNYRQTWSHGW